MIKYYLQFLFITITFDLLLILLIYKQQKLVKKEYVLILIKKYKVKKSYKTF